MVYGYQAQAVTCSRNSHGKNWYVIDSWSSVSVTRTLTAVFLINAVETVNDAITREVVVQAHRAVDGDAFEVFVVTLGAARAVTRQSTRLTDAAHNTTQSQGHAGAPHKYQPLMIRIRHLFQSFYC